MKKHGMIPVIGINSSSAPFMDDIGSFRKLYETRSKDMLRSLLNRRVILAETKQGGYMAMYSAVLLPALVIRSRDEWNRLRPLHRVPEGSRYDWQPCTRVKYLYRITGLRRLRPFMVPEGPRHGLTWMEYIF